MNIKSNILIRIYLIGGFCTVFGIIVLGKVYQIQTYKNGHWKSLADSLTTDYFEIPAERGNIYSSDDKLLATSVPFFELHVDFASKAMSDDIFQENVDSLAYYMWSKFNQNTITGYKRQLINARKNKKRYFLLCSKADYSLLKEIKRWPLFREGKFKGGLIVETRQERTNPYDYLAQRTIGLIRDNAKDIGLEEAADSLLSGAKGKILKQKIAGGEWIPINRNGQIEPKNGYDIISTLDLGLQDITETTLLQAVTQYQAEYGCAILMEVKTGAIRAMANLGKNKNSEGFSENYNYALALRYEPGSVFKTAAYLALFDDGNLTMADSINSNHASAKFGNVVLTDDGHNTQYAFLTPGKALAISSNVAIAKWIVQFYGRDKQKFYDKLEQFGLTSKTQIDLKGEVSPLVLKPDKWSAISLPWIAHGYEVKFTPLQLLTFYNAIANNGTRMKPYLIQSVLDNGKQVREYKPQSTQHKICSPKAAEFAKEILLRVVEDENGTARKIKSPYYRIAGKTGTAKMSTDHSGYSEKNLSTFVGFFPADKPLYSCVVVIGGAEGPGTTGGVVSAPIFKIMADKIITSNIRSNKAINKDSSLLEKKLPAVAGTTNAIKELNKKFNISYDFKQNWEYAKLKRDTNKQFFVSKIQLSNNKVPNVKGMLLDDAVSILENLGLKVGFVGKGKVIGQSVPANTAVIKGSYIQLVLN
ncbi:MAG: PASTA domain-containing protein [Sphingobacteriales bacterium]|nr:PASTA domain-containing protein [Sphingobacteriales bacterium]